MRVVKFLIVSTLVLVSASVRAQFNESFSDGDFATAPVWSGDASRFIIVDGKLKLQAAAVAGSSQLTTPSQAIYEAQWTFRIQLDFTPSSANFAKVYLVSDQPVLVGALNGYFVKVGNTTREVSLYRQTGTAETKIIDGLDDRINQPTVVLNVRVTRDDNGMWELFSDAASSGEFVLEGSSTDNTHSLSGWFGIQCIYSATRSDKFWFDEFLVTGTAVPDLQAPAIIQVQATDPQRIRIGFSEPVIPASIGVEKILVVGLGNPSDMILSSDGLILDCVLASRLANGVTYPVTAYGFEDGAGNIMPLSESSVRYFVPAQAKWKSVLITEMFPDPSPQVELPPVEFVEIHNPGTEPYDLSNWEFSDGSSIAVLPDLVMLPGMYVVLTSSAGANQFGTATVIPLSNFPSLNNSGDQLLLSDSHGLAVDSVRYSSSWYRDEDKAEGGWSLELIDPANPCGDADNWAAAENETGGTPGAANSIFANKPDLTPPVILSVTSNDSVRVSIVFNEWLSSTSLLDASIALTPSGVVTSIELRQDSRGIELTLDDMLQHRQSYELHLAGIRDCNGNLMEPALVSFGLPEPADSLDVLFSEILFNPRSGGVDYIEVFNASEKYINLENWVMSNGESSVSLPSKQLAPKEWLAITRDPDIVRSQYLSGQLEKSELPGLPDEEGTIFLRDNSGNIIDNLSYDHDWHSALLQSVEGVSLERVDFSGPTQNRDNWVSAASAVGFGTPGLSNSQSRMPMMSTMQVQVIPEIFSPGTLTADFVQIRYNFDQPGYISNVRIYDRRGMEVKELAANATLGSEGFLRWDGDRDNGTRAPAGYYVLWFECFDLSGRVETFRKRIILAVP